MLSLHVTAGLLAIALGFVALWAAKGQDVHRKAGTAFVVAMLALGGTGLAMAIVNSQPINIVAAGLVLYLVATGWLTVQRESAARRRATVAAMAGAAFVALFALTQGADPLGNGKASPPATAFTYVFGGFAALGAWGDLRVVMRGIEGHHRIARHLWRVGLAMLIATMSFFLGQAKVLPEAVRHPVLLAIPVLAVLVVMLYWLARVLITRTGVRA